jgi:hypothetical protein
MPGQSARTARCGVPIALSALLVLGCSAASPPPQRPTISAPASSGQTGAGTGESGPGAATGCTSAEVRQLLDAFVAAYNRGDLRALDRIVAGPDLFQWYASGPPAPRFRDDAHNRATLMDYFAGRHAAGERLQVLDFRFNGNGAVFGDFQYQLTRAGTDFESRHVIGKGAAVCNQRPRRIAVWSMG